MVTSAVAGLAAGLLASVVLAFLLRPFLLDQPSPQARIASRVTGRPPEENAGWGIVLHLVYGTLWGLGLAWGADAWLGAPAVGALGWVAGGLATGATLWYVAWVFWTPVLGMARAAGASPAQRRRLSATLLAMHLVYGAVLGGALALMPVEASAPRLGSAVPAVAGVLLAAVTIVGVALSAARRAPRRGGGERPA